MSAPYGEEEAAIAPPMDEVQSAPRYPGRQETGRNRTG